MQTRRYTRLDLLLMNWGEFSMLFACLEIQAFRLLGIDYKECVVVYQEVLTGDLVIEWR